MPPDLTRILQVVVFARNVAAFSEFSATCQVGVASRHLSSWVKVFKFLSARRIPPQGSGDTATNQLLTTYPDTNEGSDAWEVE